MTANEKNTIIVDKCQNDFLSLLFRSGKHVVRGKHTALLTELRVLVGFESSGRPVAKN